MKFLSYFLLFSLALLMTADTSAQQTNDHPVTVSVHTGPTLLDDDSPGTEFGYTFGGEVAYTYTPDEVSLTGGMGMMRVGYNQRNYHLTIGYGYFGVLWRGWMGAVRGEIYERWQAGLALRKTFQLREQYGLYAQAACTFRGGYVVGVADQYVFSVGLTHALKGFHQ